VLNSSVAVVRNNGGGDNEHNAPSMSPLLPGGASLEAGSQEWLAGSVQMLPVVSPTSSASPPAANNVHVVSQLPLCCLCDDETPATWCVTCNQAYCADCSITFHKPAKQSDHTIKQMQLQSAAAALAPAPATEQRTLQASGSRASLARPVPRVADPFPAQ
jgi:hypothetical protein